MPSRHLRTRRTPRPSAGDGRRVRRANLKRTMMIERSHIEPREPDLLDELARWAADSQRRPKSPTRVPKGNPRGREAPGSQRWLPEETHPGLLGLPS